MSFFIRYLRNSCSKVVWDELLESIIVDRSLRFVTLAGLVNIKLAKVTCDGRPIDAVELHCIFKKIVYHTQWSPSYKVLHRKDIVQVADGGYEKCNLSFKFEGRPAQCSFWWDVSSDFFCTTWNW